MEHRMKIPAFSVIALVAFATGAFAQSMPGETMLLLDEDGDGQVTYEEFSEEMLPMFDAMDTDKDGKLEFNEVESFMSRDQFDPADTNSDGVISKQEYGVQIRKDFESADQDGSGVLN